MIVYHTAGEIVAYHSDTRDAPPGSYPGTSRAVVDDAAFRATQAHDNPDTRRALFVELASVATASAVRAEAQRRMMLATGARDAAHLSVIVSNAQREAIRLLRIRDDRAWTPEETARAAYLEAADAAIEAIRNASNAMEPAPPADFANDSHWPVM